MTGAQQPPDGEQTFADVLNGLAFGGRRVVGVESIAAGWPGVAVPERAEAEFPGSDPAGVDHYGGDPAGADAGAVESAELLESAAMVRPYSWTRGRTRAAIQLQLETLVSVAGRLSEAEPAPLEHRTIVELCRTPRSVAEVAALLGVPLGVAKVLIGDLAETGLVTVHHTVTGIDGRAHLNLMERVLSGLRRL